jgi:signal transduction histidine kinase
MLTSSLRRRLLITSGLWIIATLVVTAALLIYLAQTYIEKRFDAELFDHLEEIVAAAERQSGGTVRLTWIPSDPRFRREGSGWYWQIGRNNEVLARSHSVSVYHRLGPAEAQGRKPHSAFEFTGPSGERLRGMTDSIATSADKGPINVLVTGPVAQIDRDVVGFASRIAIVLAALGAGLILALVTQVSYGLRPLRSMHRSLVDIHEGRRNRMPDVWPGEIQPIVEDLNRLLDHNTALIERARSQAGNLAHALKNPLTVIGNEATHLDSEHGRVIREQASTMRLAIDRYSSRARTAGSANLLGTPVSVTTVLEDLLFTMHHIYRERALGLHVDGCKQCHFRGEAQDLEEMLGNLLDNACKWAASDVFVSCHCRASRLMIVVEDDGPGIPEELLGEATERGARLDEAKPGSGLGLSIVREVATLYHGSLALSRSPRGGLKAELDLPSSLGSIPSDVDSPLDYNANKATRDG